MKKFLLIFIPAIVWFKSMAQIYVNDSDLSGDVYTTAVGSDSNTGTADSPFATISHAVNQAFEGDTIFVDAGIFSENVYVWKAVKLMGPNAGISPNDPENPLNANPARVAEAEISYVAPAGGEWFLTNVVTVYANASGFELDGFTLDGLDKTVAGRRGFRNWGTEENSSIVNNIVKNVNEGLSYSSPQGVKINYNRLIEIGGTIAAIVVDHGNVATSRDNNQIIGNVINSSVVRGILLNNFNVYAQIEENVIRNAQVGIQIGQVDRAATTPGFIPTISNNDIQTWFYGIWVNQQFGNVGQGTLPTAWQVKENIISKLEGISPQEMWGIFVSGINIGASVNLMDNTIDGADYGIRLWNIASVAGVNISGGAISNCSLAGISVMTDIANSGAGYTGGRATYNDQKKYPTVYSLNIADVDLINNTTGIQAVRHTGGVVNNTSSALIDLSVQNVNIIGGVHGMNAYISNGLADVITAEITESSITGQSDLRIQTNVTSGVSAPCNWWGTDDPSLLADIFNEEISENVAVLSFLNDGADLSLDSGFQPDPYTCVLLNLGCTDDNACNYDVSATVNNGSCTYTCYGCTDSNSPDYDAAATIDDGSCNLCLTSNGFDNAVATADNEGDGVWYTDRYAPGSFSSPVNLGGQSTLRQIIFEFDGGQYRPAGFEGSFYDTQGRNFSLEENVTAVQIDLYIPSAWASTGRSMAGLGGVALNVADAPAAYPLIEFTSDSAGTNQPQPRFRAYGSGEWIDMGLPIGFAYDTWVTLEIQLIPSTSEFNYKVGDLVSATSGLSAAGSQSIGVATLQGYNTYDGVTYTINWDNFIFGVDCAGCTDELAVNYDPQATVDDGSCTYPAPSYTGLSFEVYANDQQNGLGDGFVTYRVYANFDNPYDQLTGIYGVVDDNEQSPLSITLSNPLAEFYQSEFGGVTSENVNPLFFAISPELEFDSYLTIGADSTSNTITVLPGNLLFDEDGMNVTDEIGAIVYVIAETQPLAYAGEDGKVLIGQFTTNGIATVTVNLQYLTQGGASLTVPQQTITFPEFIYGCTDMDACNYNPLATSDDSSCTIAGCTDPEAPNFNAAAACDDGSCDYTDLTALYVNDADLTGDVYTTAVGSDSNTGTANSPFATIAFAISQAQAGDTIYVDAGLYEEQLIDVNKSLAILGPNEAVAGNGSRGDEAIIQFPGDAGVDATLFYVGGGVHNVTISGFDLRCQDSFVGDYQTLIGSWSGLPVNNLTIRNNRMYSSYLPIYMLAGYGANNGTGVLIEGNYIDCGPHVNSSYNRGMYIGGTSGIIQDNVLLNCNIGIQYMPYNNPNPGYIRRNSVAAALAGLYHNYQTKGAGLVTWEDNTVTVAANPRITGSLATQVFGPWSENQLIGFRGIHVLTFGTEQVGNPPSVLFRNNFVDATNPNTVIPGNNNPSNVFRAGWLTAASFGTVTLENNSFVNFTNGFVRNADAPNTTVTATCNWWGSSDWGTVSAATAGTSVFTPWLTNGLDADLLTTGFQPAPGSCDGTPGCTDQSACNYDISATVDDGSCEYSCLTALYVNDADLTGDVYTTAVGSDSNTGTANSPFATIAFAISQAQAGDTIYVDAGLYEEQFIVNKQLTFLGPNADVAGYDVRSQEAIIQFPAGAVNGSSLIKLNSNLHDVTIAGFDIRCQDATIPNYHYLIFAYRSSNLDAMEKWNNLSVRNNRMYGSEIPVYILTDFDAHGSGLIIEGNYIDGGPNVNSVYNRGLYVGGTSGTIQDNVLENCNIAIQYMPYGNPNPGLIRRNTVSASLIGLYNNYQTNGAALVTWEQNVVSAASNPQTGLSAQVDGARVSPAQFNGIYINSHGIQGAGAPPVALFQNNAINAAQPANTTSTVFGAIFLENAVAGAEAIFENNSFTGYTFGVDRALNASGVTVTATCNWWGSSEWVTVSEATAEATTFLPFLTNGTDNDPAMGFQSVPESCNGTPGCTDDNACNYDVSATVNNGSCTYTCYGCTDSNSPDYDAAATIDDGSCGLCDASEVFSSAIITANAQTPGAWYVDRYAPAAFSSPIPFGGDQRLRHVIVQFDGGQFRPAGFEGSFYDIQGRKLDLEGDITAMSVDLFVPSHWATSGRRMAGFWGTAFNASDAISGDPIIEFTSDFAGTNQPQPRFRVYNNGSWVDMGLPTGFAYNTWVTLEIQLIPSTSEFLYRVGDLVTATTGLSGNASERIGNVALQGHNTNDGVTYTIYWDNFTSSSVPVDTWYADADSDGFGDSAVSMVACTQPLGFVADNTDCDDSDANEFPGQTWYIDADGDNYGASSETACLRPVNGYLLSELSGTGTDDCDDSNALVNPAVEWHADADGDGYGDPLSTTSSCTQPLGYVADNTDCDDNDSNEFPGQTWYIDADGDNYGASSEVACLRPVNGYLLSELSGTGTDDCDDSNASVNPAVVWYADADGDGYGDPLATTASCTQPLGFVADNADCNDSDANEFPGQTWYIDADGDNYGASSETACLRPVNGYLLSELSGTGTDDCDDSNASVNPAVVWYADTDGDGYGDPLVTTASCTQPSGYVSDSTDCDDSDSDEFPAQTWYIDADGDGYGASSQMSCLRPANGYLLSELSGSGTDDCDDSSALVSPELVWYADVDGDGYGDPLATTTSCTQPSGYVADNTDCNDANVAVNPLSVWWIDNDGDGYGDDAIIFAGCTPPSGYALSNLGLDCLDSNSNVYPGAPATQEGLDNNCDGMLSEQEECLCLGDYNFDEQRNVSDILMLLGSYGCAGNCPTDLSGDNAVDTADMLIFLTVFGYPCPVYIDGQGCVIPE